MKKFLFLVFFAAAFAFAASPKVIGYFPSWVQYSQFAPSDVRYGFLSDIRYCCLVPNGSGLLFADESDRANFIELVKLSKVNNVRIFASVGGIGNEVAMLGVSAKDFEQAAKAFVKEYGIDGFELDGGATNLNGAKKIAELAGSLANAGLVVSIAIQGEASFAQAIPTSIASRLDAVSLWFTDQMSASESIVKPNSNTTDNIKTLAAFAGAGIPKEKLIAIVPLYGKSFEGAKSLGSSFTGIGSGNEGILQYKGLMDKFKNVNAYKVNLDDASQSEVAVNEYEIIVFNGIPSMQAMAIAVKDNGYGGLAVFDVSGDHKEPIISLLVSIGQILRPDVNYKRKK
jgi:GH18 family chitinase